MDGEPVKRPTPESEEINHPSAEVFKDGVAPRIPHSDAVPATAAIWPEVLRLAWPVLARQFLASASCPSKA